MIVSPALLSSTIGVIAYYAFAWVLVGRDPEPGPLVSVYRPPRGISPAMLRYVWKEVFDDRTVWSGVLSLVSKGLATMESSDGAAVLRVTDHPTSQSELSPEERVVFAELRRSPKKGMTISMLDGRMCLAVAKMAEILRRAAVDTWFKENRQYVNIGTVLSAVALCFASSPRHLDEWYVLAASLAFMAPGSFYLLLLVARIRDLFKATRARLDGALIRRTALLVVFLTCCLASIVLGNVVLGATFGWPIVVLVGFFAALNLTFLRLMRAPTTEGRKLMDEIEGFRLFLTSVEQPTMDWSESPKEQPGVYERYLPYAVALEVEQAWSDRFVALVSSFHQPDAVVRGAQSLYLGMWDGKPVEVLYQPRAGRGGG